MTSSCGSSARRSKASSPTARVASRTSSSTSPASATTGAARTRSSTLAKRAAGDLDYASTIEDASFRDLVVGRPVRGDRPEDHQRPGSRGRRADRHRARGRRGRACPPEQRVDRRLPPALHGDRRGVRAAVRAEHRSTSRSRRSTRRWSATARDWFRIDQLYRQFTFARRTAEGPHPLEPLREQVEKRYTNKFVYELGNAWQQQVDAGRPVELVGAALADARSTATTSSRSSATATRRPSSSSPMRCATRSPTSSAPASARRTASTPTSRPSSACCRATRNSAWRRCCRTAP